MVRGNCINIKLLIILFKNYLFTNLFLKKTKD